MRLSLATRNFLGYAVVLVTFGAVSIFGVVELHRNQVEIRLVSEGYLQLSQKVAKVQTFHNYQVENTAGLSGERQPEKRRNLIQLARSSSRGLMPPQIAEGREKAHQAMEFAPASEVPYLHEVEQKLDELEKRYVRYESAADSLYATLEPEQPDWDQVAVQSAELRQLESSLSAGMERLALSLEARIRERVRTTEQREQRTGVAILGLSVLAIAVGLLATALSARRLRPVATLIEGVSRIGRGDYSAELGVKGDDEISVLAREFDAMARSLREREAQLKDQQEALLRAEQLAAVGRISAQIAHEVRNPLSSIGLNVEMLEEQLERAHFPTPAEAAEARELLGSVTREVDRLTAVTEEYLRMARPPQPSLVPEDVNGVLESVLDFSREELQRAGVEVDREFDASEPRALVDEGQLRQVFLNLVRNSREAMATGGRLTVGSLARVGEVEVRFSDTGPGIAPGVREQIFEPFFSTKSGGTGLGLAVSRQILHAHGGSIECENGPSGGTTFVVRLKRS